MALLETKRSSFEHWLWDKKSQREMPYLKNTLQIIYALVSDLKEGQLSLRAMSLVYTTILSLVPLFAISFSILKGLGAHNQIRPFLLNTLAPLGDKKIEITDKIIGFVDNIQVGVLGSLGIIILLYTVIGMLQKIEFSFNYVWHVEKARHLSKRLSDYLSVLIVGPVLILASTAMTTSTHSRYIIEKISLLPGSGYIIALTGEVIPYIILALAFTFFYSFIPNTKVQLKSAAIGGLTTAFLWKLMGWVFTVFVANSSKQAAIYSAFASILVFMVWVYLVWLVLLIGASISFYIQYPELRRIRHKSFHLSGADKEDVALQIMEEVASRFIKERQAATSASLSSLLQVPHKAIDDIACCLKQHHLLTTEEQSGAWLLAKSPDTIGTYDIIAAIRMDKGELLSGHAKEIDDVLKKQFSKTTLKHMID